MLLSFSDIYVIMAFLISLLRKLIYWFSALIKSDFIFFFIEVKDYNMTQ